MPNIDKITEVLYDGNQPYHVEFDNLPLKNILTRIDLVNSQVDINSDILRASCGSVGTLENRLAASIEDDGKLKKQAVDSSLHNIGSHEDGEYNGVEYVRMRKDERDKLTDIRSEANKIEVEIEDSISSETIEYYTISNGKIRLRASDSTAFEFNEPDIIKIHSVYSPSAMHIHHYEVEPAHAVDVSDPDYYKSYKTTIMNTAFINGSLRVYINGTRINSASSTKVLIGSQPSVDANWKDIYLESQDPTTGTFSLNTTIESSTNIFIDFNTTT